MAEKKEWLGITQNEMTIQGKVIADPQIVGQQGSQWALFKVRTSIREPGANGQWTDTVIDIPVMCNDQQKVDAMQKYVQAGRELLIRAYYKAWTDQQNVEHHGFMMKTFELGSKPYVPKDKDTAPAIPG